LLRIEKVDFFKYSQECLFLKHHSNRSEYSGKLRTLCLEAAMNHYDSVFSPVLQQSGWIKNRIWGIQDGKKSWNFHQTVRSLWSIQEKIFKVQFSCLLTVQRTKIKFWSQLGAWLRQILGSLQEKNPPRVGKYKNLEMHYSLSPHISPRPPPLGEADDKCINTVYVNQTGYFYFRPKRKSTISLPIFNPFQWFPFCMRDLIWNITLTKKIEIWRKLPI